MAEQEEQSESVDAEAGSKKKLMMMVGGAVGVLILVGAGLFFSGFFDDEPAEPTAEESMDADTDSDSNGDENDDAGNEDGGKIAANTAIYHALMPPFMVNFPGGNIQVMKLAVSVMASEQAVIDAISLHDPVIRNNILLMLSSQDPEVLKTAKGKVKLQLTIKTEINKVLDSVKVSSSVKNVFFTDLVMQ
ncbi:flagellar basal body-associated protein FliL [Cycloclasticus sp. 46_83_sub15_T18]|nr:flagellar basal body-associated protein FliL [Cycloclasticus sp. 46_83_sub15_T18]